jgi:hypothetical protein
MAKQHKGNRCSAILLRQKPRHCRLEHSRGRGQREAAVENHVVLSASHLHIHSYVCLKVIIHVIFKGLHQSYRWIICCRGMSCKRKSWCSFLLFRFFYLRHIFSRINSVAIKMIDRKDVCDIWWLYIEIFFTSRAIWFQKFPYVPWMSQIMYFLHNYFVSDNLAIFT